MDQNNIVINWLLESNNPPARYRTLTELLNKPYTDINVIETKNEIVRTLSQAADTSWMKNVKGLWLIYNLLALAECGLCKSDIDVSTALMDYFNKCAFDTACGDGLMLRALVALGFKDDERVRTQRNAFYNYLLPDGGLLCRHRVKKLKYTPKSCIKDNMHILLMLAECKKHGLEFEYANKLLDYFLDRRIFYRSGKPDELVLDCRAGWRMTDNFFPAEVMRIGLPQLLYAFALLGAGNAPELSEAWEMLDQKKDKDGKYILEGTLSKSYLPREKINKPGKWVTLYSLLALKYRDGGLHGR